MTFVHLLAVVASCGLVAASAARGSQAQYEIGYVLSGTAEQVRAEDYPFSVRAQSGEPRGDAFQFLYGTFPTARSPSSLIDLYLYRESRSDASTDSVTAIRFDYRIEDLVFSGDGSGPIEVDLTLLAERGPIRICHGDDCNGVEYLTELAVTLGDDVRSGTSKVTLDGSREPTRERTGILEAWDSTPILELRGLVVPTHVPVTLSIEYSSWIRFPIGTIGGLTIRGGDDAIGYLPDQQIFTLPNGWRVDSASGQIKDNRYRPCRADLDTDGELTVYDMLTFQNLFSDRDFISDFDGDGEFTIFDFLNFQNAFDAGCP